MFESFTAAHFTPKSEEAWNVHLPDGQTVALQVVETDVRGDPRPFSVRFSGPLQPQLPQATFEVEHAPIGRALLFLVPVARTQDAMHYEAVFA